MIPPRYAPALFAFILSGAMSCIVSGVATLRALGLVPDFFSHWMSAWMFSWAVAFPMVLIIAPVTRRIVDRLTDN